MLRLQCSPRLIVLLVILGLPLFVLTGVIVACNLVISYHCAGRIFSKPDQVPENSVGVVLGTSKLISANRPNLHFETRMKAAADLYRQEKIRHILVSGSHNSRYYNEVRDMRDALISLGVPTDAITEDPSGFRTLDSVVRASRVFGQVRYTIISDDFHVGRAVFLARRQHSDVVGYAADRISMRYSIRSRMREFLARIKAVLDVYVFNTQPRQMDLFQPIEVASGVVSSS
jgi:SanA protein